MATYKHVYIVYKRDIGPKAKKDSGAIKRVYYYDQPANVKPPDDGYGVLEFFTWKTFAKDRFRIDDGKMEEVRVRAKFVKSTRVHEHSDDGTGRYDIVLVSDKVDSSTGFGTQTNYLYRGLMAKGHNVHALHFQEADTLLNLRFDYVISLGDFYQVNGANEYPDLVEMGLDNWIHWLPISNTEIDEEFWKRIRAPRHLVAMSSFGHKTLTGRGFSNTTFIPHGIEMDIFRPLHMAELEKLRKSYQVADQFVVVFVGRNTKRKRIDHLLEIFAKVIESTGNDAPVKFLLKTEEQYTHINVTQYAKELDRKKDINLHEHIMLYDENVTPGQLNELYNLATVGISATGGEGFGLTTLECIAAGVPMIIGRHSTSEEILGDTGVAGSLIDISETQTDHPHGVAVGRSILDADQAVNVLLEFYKKWENDQVPNRLAVRAQVKGRYTVNSMVDAWDSLLYDLSLSKEEDEGAEEAVSYRRVADLDEPISLPEI